MLKALIKAEAIFKQACQRYEVIDQQLYADPAINHTRIARNHAQIIAFLEMLPHVIPITPQRIEETHTFIIQLARERVKEVQEDPDDINEFWAVFDYLDSEDVFGVNYAGEAGIYAVNFNQLAQVVSEKRQPFLDIVAMKKRLKMGKARKFIRTKSMRSRVNANYNTSLSIGSTLKKPKVVECWIFESRTA